MVTPLIMLFGIQNPDMATHPTHIGPWAGLPGPKPGPKPKVNMWRLCWAGPAVLVWAGWAVP